MEETAVIGEATHESLQKHGNGRISDAEALRTVILVVGFILFIPGLIYLVIGLASMATSPGYAPEDYRTYVWTTRVTGIAGTAGAVVVGYLLLRIARKRSVYSVGEMLYPAVTAVGVYLVLMAAVQVLNPIVFHYLVVGDFSSFVALSAVMMGLYELPYFIGGVLLVMIGRHRYPARR